MESISILGRNRGLQVGVNNGHISTEFHHHLPPERPETPPSPLSTVPFPHDSQFVRRGTLLRQIHDQCRVPGSSIALVGLGGVGKSQLAIEYSYQVRSESPGTWVFWIYASNEARFEQSFRDIADQVKIPGRKDPRASIFKLVESWLRDEKKGKWVCIVDNVDDDKLNCSLPGAGKPLLEYIPRSSHRSTIITSRSKEIALKMVKPRNLVEVSPMARSEALELLEKILDQPEHSRDNEHLVEALELMPLAIVQAASYIRKRIPLCSVPEYLRDLQRSDRRATDLLEKEAGHSDRDWEANNSILVTWQLSFERIRHDNPYAAEILSLMSFFDRQGIPECLVKRQFKVGNGSSDGKASESDARHDFGDAIAALSDYSFVYVSETTKLFTMHRLVQLATRVWLEYHGQLDVWREKFIHNLWEEFPSTGEYENWEKCRSLFPHVKLAMSQQPKSVGSLKQWSTLLYRGAWYALKSGNFADAREMASRSRVQRVLLLGEEHKETTQSTSMLAEAYTLDGRWEEAEQLFVQVMNTLKTLAEDHPDIMTSMSDLALTYNYQGRWEEARQLREQLLHARKIKLGQDHPDTMNSMADLASTYNSQGRWEEARKLREEVLYTRKIKFGDDHPDTLTSMADLAVTYSCQGEWEEAKKLQEEVLQNRKIKLGQDHPDTLTSMADLAVTLWEQGRWTQAERLEVQVMRTRKRKFGEDHPDTLSSMTELVSTYGDQGRWKEAEKLEVQVMAMCKAKLGEDHPDTLNIMAHLALSYRRQGQWKKSEDFLRQVTETSKVKLGEDHPVTLNTLAQLGLTYNDQGMWKRAERLFIQVLETSKAKLGEDHPFTLTCKANLASTYTYQGQWEQAECLELQVLESRRGKLSDDHPDMLSSVANLASTYSIQGRWQEAEHLFGQVIETSKANLGEDHPSTLNIIANLALMYSDQGRWEEAKNLQVHVMETRQTKLSYNHPDTLASMVDLAFTWKYLCHDVEAINLLRDCLTKQKHVFGPKHPITSSNSETLRAWETERKQETDEEWVPDEESE